MAVTMGRTAAVTPGLKNSPTDPPGHAPKSSYLRFTGSVGTKQASIGDRVSAGGNEPAPLITAAAAPAGHAHDL